MKVPLTSWDSTADCLVSDCTTVVGGHTDACIGLVLNVNNTVAEKAKVDVVPDVVVRTGRGVRAVLRKNVLVTSPILVKTVYSNSSL